jgi:hypothetical protein
VQLVRRRNARLTALLAGSILAVGVAAAPASAQTQQSGLVNVAVVDNTVQIPIGVAANVCQVQVGVLASALQQGPVTCTAVAGATATAPAPGPGGTTQQNGLVNLAVTNNTIQVPVGIAANICGVQAGVLANDLRQGAAQCNALGNATATAPPAA